MRIAYAMLCKCYASLSTHFSLIRFMLYMRRGLCLLYIVALCPLMQELRALKTFPGAGHVMCERDLFIRDTGVAMMQSGRVFSWGGCRVKVHGGTAYKPRGGE